MSVVVFYTFANFLIMDSNGLSVIGGLDYWNGLLEWTTGMDYWNGLCPFFFFFPHELTIYIEELA